jgi:membrane-bound metal-dependent hydrolase YbcI (DUF457 family)
VHTAGAGIPTIAVDSLPVLGYSGFLNFDRAIRRVFQHRGFLHAAQNSPSSYKATWLERSPNWHIKQEVK